MTAPTSADPAADPAAAPIGRAELVERLRTLLGRSKHPDRPLVVGITGMDTSGKSRLADELADALAHRATPHQVVHIDDFHHPRAHRYRPDLPEPEQYYAHSIDFERAARDVLRPIRDEGRLDTELTLLDLPTDTPTLRRRYTVGPRTTVIVEGVFLLRPEVRDLIDLFVHLDVREDVVLERARIRDVPGQGEDVMRKYGTKYLPAQRAYLAAHPPARHAHVLVDNSDWTNPVVLRWPDAHGDDPHGNDRHDNDAHDNDAHKEDHDAAQR
ncbi:hypothetical protein [Kitasatospora sp. NPDC085879]|uniref:hypothetical protein n=1 Tax=Kitasatospora sp. NPDC085879 TaxID=3154769 RepID=UPI0034348B36